MQRAGLEEGRSLWLTYVHTELADVALFWERVFADVVI